MIAETGSVIVNRTALLTLFLVPNGSRSRITGNIKTYMIMEIAESIFKFILASLNVCALAFTLILVRKWHRMENKLDEIERYVRHVSDRNDIVYINQLSELQRLLIKEERYEEADKIGKIIKDEEIKLGIRE